MNCAGERFDDVVGGHDQKGIEEHQQQGAGFFLPDLDDGRQQTLEEHGRPTETL